MPKVGGKAKAVATGVCVSRRNGVVSYTVRGNNSVKLRGRRANSSVGCILSNANGTVYSNRRRLLDTKAYRVYGGNSRRDVTGVKSRSLILLAIIIRQWLNIYRRGIGRGTGKTGGWGYSFGFGRE